MEPKCHTFDLYLALSLVLLTLSLGYVLMVPGICGVYHDDAIYVIIAKALAQGDGYRLINLPQAPFQTKYPIVFPALLAVIWKLWPTFPGNVAAMQWLTLSSAGVFVGLTYLYLVTWGYATRPVALLAGALTATSPVFLYYGTLTLSEMPFSCLMVGRNQPPADYRHRRCRKTHLHLQCRDCAFCYCAAAAAGKLGFILKLSLLVWGGG